MMHYFMEILAALGAVLVLFGSIGFIVRDTVDSELACLLFFLIGAALFLVSLLRLGYL